MAFMSYANVSIVSLNDKFAIVEQANNKNRSIFKQVDVFLRKII